MPYVTKEQIAAARQMDLLTYMQNFHPAELVPTGPHSYRLKSHDSVTLSNGKWCRNSRGYGGVSALDYLVMVENETLPEAVSIILSGLPYVPSSPQVQAPERIPFQLPWASRNTTGLASYLSMRGIADNIIGCCIENGSLYQDRRGNAVFVGFNGQHKPCYAFKRSTNVDSTWLGEVGGSDKRYSFELSQNPENDTLHLFESCIDTLSFGTIMSLDGLNWKEENIKSLSGVYVPKKQIEQSSLPRALEQYLKEHRQIRVIRPCFDNDEAGRLAAYTLEVILDGRYEVAPLFPARGKDYNEYVQLLQGISPHVKMRGKGTGPKTKGEAER